MKLRIAFALTAVLVSAAAVVATAGSSPTKASVAPVDWSSAASARKYVRSLGIDTRGLVIQRGSRLYAGDDCPGRGWSCTDATRVLQISAAGGQTRFECSPSTGDPPAGFPPVGFPDPSETDEPTVCVIVQANTTGDNVARCVERSNDPEAVLQCSIAQINEEGDNRAFYDQAQTTQEGDDQNGELSTEVIQQNDTGGNFVQGSQSVHQIARQRGGFVSQDQTANVDLVIDQDSDTGRQSVHAHQNVHLDENATGPVLGGSQDQFSDLDGFVTQNSVDVSDATVSQHELLNQNAPKDTVSQFQFGPLDCCTDQFSNEKNRFNIDQSSQLNASSEDADQTSSLNASCVTTGLCTATQHAKIDGDQEQNSCRDSECFIQIFCQSFGGGEEVFTTQQAEGECFASSGGDFSVRRAGRQARR